MSMNSATPDCLSFHEIKGSLGFGFLRLPMKESILKSLARYILKCRREKINSSVPSQRLQQVYQAQRENKFSLLQFAKKAARRLLGKSKVNIRAVNEMVDAFMSAGLSISTST